MTSTNELLAAVGGVGIISSVMSIAVSALQILLFVAIINKSTNFNTPDLSFELVLVRVFITIYLSAYLVQSISEAFWSPFCGEVEFTDYTTFLFLFLFVLFLPIAACSFIVLAVRIGNWVEARVWVAILLEYSVQVSSLCATLLITKQQTDIINSVYNFAGLLLILELDDQIARLLKWKIVPYDPTHSSDRAPEYLAAVKERNISVMQIIIFCVMIVPLLAYLLD
jgi:hypothetical protein